MNVEMQQAITALKQQVVELEKQIAQAKKNKSDAETVKGLEDTRTMLNQQLSLMQELTESLSLIPDESFQETTEEKAPRVPERDSFRINSLPKELLSDAELSALIKKTHAEVEKKISPLQKEGAAMIFEKAKEDKQSPASVGLLASLCWMNGYQEAALYLLGKACIEDMSNADNLNNYAAFLTSTGGEHLAIPILEKLESKYPDNSTILNNLGQAWFGLGNTSKAREYLDRALAAFPRHSRANQTRCEIAQATGNTQQAIDFLKQSIREHYTSEKEIRLEELGGKPKFDEMPFPYPKKANPLGLEKFTGMTPDYPMTIDDADINNALWVAFKDALRKEIEKLRREKIELKRKSDAYTQQMISQPITIQPYNTRVQVVASRKLALLGEWAHDEQMRFNDKYMQANASISTWYQEFNTVISSEASCGAKASAALEYISKSNMLLSGLNDQYVTYIKHYTKEAAIYTMYSSLHQTLYDLQINGLKEQFLSYLASLPYKYVGICKEQPREPPAPPRTTLPDFDVLNCEYKTELSIPYMESLFSIKVECNRMTTKFDLPYIRGELVENLNTTKSLDVIKGSVEISQGFSSDPLKGPLSAEMEMKIGAFVEFDNSGIADVGVKGELSATVSTDNLDTKITMGDRSEYSVPGVSEQKLEFGVGVRSSWNAGTTVSGTGILSGSRVSFK